MEQEQGRGSGDFISIVSTIVLVTVALPVF